VIYLQRAAEFVTRCNKDVIVLKLLKELDVAGYEIVRKPATRDSHSKHRAVTEAYSSTRPNWQERAARESLTGRQWH
jgi:hypothetical protein